MISHTARLGRIQVFPIKSLDGIELEQARILPSGALQFDRQFALEDSLGKFINAKRTSQCHQIRAEFNADDFSSQRKSPRLSVRLSSISQPHWSTFELDAENPELLAWFSREFHMPISLSENTVVGYPDDVESTGPTVIATPSIHRIGQWFELADDEVRRRLRANLELIAEQPFWEDQLYQAAGEPLRFQIGDVVFAGTNPCQRCVVPSRDSQTGAVADPKFAARFSAHRADELPSWAYREQFNHFYRISINTQLVTLGSGTIKIGDELTILD